MDLNGKLIFFFLFEAGGRSEASRDRLAAAPVARCDETQRDASCSRPRWGSSHSGTEQVPFSSVPELNQGKRTKEYSECSYILRLFPWKHPLHESDISFTEWCPSSGCATLPSTPPPSLAQPAGLTPGPWIPLPVPSPGARGRSFDGLQLPLWFSKKKKTHKDSKNFLKVEKTPIYTKLDKISHSIFVKLFLLHYLNSFDIKSINLYYISC